MHQNEVYLLVWFGSIVIGVTDYDRFYSKNSSTIFW